MPPGAVWKLGAKHLQQCCGWKYSLIWPAAWQSTEPHEPLSCPADHAGGDRVLQLELAPRGGTPRQWQQ
jgi:hypothetical protein